MGDNITPRPLAVGDRVQDDEALHRFATTRVGTIEVLYPYGARIRLASGKTTIVLGSRIHLDGKPRKSGWSRRVELSHG